MPQACPARWKHSAARPFLNQQAYITSPMRSPIFTMVSAPCNVFRIRSLSGKTLSGSRAAQPLNLRISNLLFLRPRFTWQRLFYNFGSFRPSVHRLPSSGRCRVFHFLQDSILCCSFCRSGRYHLQSDLQCEKIPGILL